MESVIEKLFAKGVTDIRKMKSILEKSTGKKVSERKLIESVEKFIELKRHPLPLGQRTADRFPKQPAANRHGDMLVERNKDFFADFLDSYQDDLVDALKSAAGSVPIGIHATADSTGIDVVNGLLHLGDFYGPDADENFDDKFEQALKIGDIVNIKITLNDNMTSVMRALEYAFEGLTEDIYDSAIAADLDVHFNSHRYKDTIELNLTFTGLPNLQVTKDVEAAIDDLSEVQSEIIKVFTDVMKRV